VNVTAEILTEAFDGLAVEVRSGNRVYSACLLSPEAVAKEVARRIAERHPEPPLLFPAEAAAMLNLSTAGLARRARAGQVPCEVTPGGHRRFREADIRALVRRKSGLPLTEEEHAVLCAHEAGDLVLGGGAG
jgi:hypothetical protein